MPWVLGIETATDLLSIGIATENGVAAERSVRGRRLHSVRLLPFIKDLLVDSGISVKNLSGIGVSTGPGSFTGLRLGLITAKTLAEVLHIPVVGISTLLVMATPLLPGALPVCPILTSRKEEVYAAVYQADGEKVETMIPPFAASPPKVLEKLNTFSKVIVVGEGKQFLRKDRTFPLDNAIVLAPDFLDYPQGSVVAALALKEMAARRPADHLRLKPEYLRPPAITGGFKC